jgi:hypothetical protein
MRSTSFLTFDGLLVIASAAPLPLEAQQTHLARRAYKDVTQVLERMTLTITKCADDVRQWPGNPRLATTLPQISQWAQTIIQDSNSLLSDLLIGTDYIKRNQQPQSRVGILSHCFQNWPHWILQWVHTRLL